MLFVINTERIVNPHETTRWCYDQDEVQGSRQSFARFPRS